MARFSPDFCLTFLPGCSSVPAADAVMLFMCKSPSTITAWFLTYPLVNLWVSSFLIWAMRLSSFEILRATFFQFWLNLPLFLSPRW